MPAAVRAGSGSLYVSISLSRWKILWCWWGGRGNRAQHTRDKKYRQPRTTNGARGEAALALTSVFFQGLFKKSAFRADTTVKQNLGPNLLLSWSHWYNRQPQRRMSPPEISITVALKRSGNNTLLVSAKLRETRQSWESKREKTPKKTTQTFKPPCIYTYG